MILKKNVLMKEKITGLNLAFATPIWTSTIPKNREINENKNQLRSVPLFYQPIIVRLIS